LTNYKKDVTLRGEEKEDIQLGLSKLIIRIKVNICKKGGG
jgi:hypothetical protein